MSWFGELWRRFLFLFQRDKMATDLADEMRLHLQLRAEEHAADGVKHGQAEDYARRAFGNITQLSEQGRAVWGWAFLESLANGLDQHACGPDGPVAVISYAFWKERFAGDPNIVGKTFTIDRHPFQIAGVTPSWFRGRETDRSYDLRHPDRLRAVLHTYRSALAQRSWWWLYIVGRLRDGETVQQAKARLDAITPY